MIAWFVVAGAIAVAMAYASGRVRRLPLSAALVYLGIGYLLGPNGLGLLALDPHMHSNAIEAITLIVIAISIFSSALKLRTPLLDRQWLNPLRLAFLTMVLTVGGLMAAGHFLLGLPLGAALLLGAILAPTDPVLASDVQVERPFNFHRLRFSLTGEAGLNDGSAMPLVLLGLALVGTHPVSTNIWRWVLLHVVWGFLGAGIIGGAIGHFGARYMLHLRMAHGEKLASDNFLAIGIIGLSFGLASMAHAIGFVAVFVAGLAVRGIERRMDKHPPEFIRVKVGDPVREQEAAQDPRTAAEFLVLRMELFTEGLEQIGEAIVVLIVGGLLRNPMLAGGTLAIAALLFFVIRPIAVFASAAGAGVGWAEKSMVGWFGIRGMASVYYLAYIYRQGVPQALVDRLAGVALGVIAYSILLHGSSVTPLMRWFDKRAESRE